MRGILATLGSFSRHRMVREFLGFGSSTVLEQVSRVLTSLLVAGLVGPVAWGSWYVLNLIVRYGALTHLGALNGLNRQYALEMGRGDSEEAAALQRASLGALLVSIAVVVLVAPALLGIVAPRDALLSLALTLLLLLFQQLYNYVTTVFRARIRFSQVSRLQAVVAVSNPLISLPFSYLYGLNGFIFGQAINYALAVAIAWWTDRELFKPQFDLARARRLVQIGFPIMLVGVLFALFTTVDRFVVLELMSVEDLGHYSIAIMALGSAALLPQIVSQQFYPRMSRRWGANRDIDELSQLARTQGRLGLLPTIAVVAAAEVIGPPVIMWLLPEYAAGIPAFRVVLLGPIVNCFGQGYANLLNVIDRQYHYMAIMVGSILANAAFSYLLGSHFGLVGVAWGTVIAFAVFSLGLVILGNRTAARF